MAGMAILPSSGFIWPEPTTGNDFSTLLSKLIPLNDDTVNQLWENKIDNPTSKWHGGYVNQYDIPNAHSTSAFVVRGCIAYFSKKSRFHDSDSLRADIESALDCMLRIQYKDGTIDLYSTNFHSTPDTAFIVNDLVPVYKMMTRLDDAKLDSLLDKLKTFILRAGEAFLVGGIHTANHRWVVSAALARVFSIDARQSYIDRMEEWLAEGIDQDEDGQYHEQSVSIYSPICDNMFLAIGNILDRKEFLDIVRKNLEMTLYYILPNDGEVLTEASDRQDKSTVGYVSRYYLAYRYFAVADQNGQFSSVCRLIEDKMLSSIVSYIPYFFEFEEYQNNLPAHAPLPAAYFKYFRHSGVIRFRNGNMDLSVIEHNPTFMILMKGKVALQSIRLAAAFFGDKGQFIPEDVSIEGDKIILRKSITHGYYQPIPEDQTTGVNGWIEYPRKDREMSELQTMNYKVTITPSNQKVQLDMEISGTDNVPVSCEMSFRSGDLLSGTVEDLNNANSYFLKEGHAEFHNQGDVLKVGPGKMEHQWAQMRGMLPKQDGESIYITGVTPFRHTLYFW